MFLKMWKMRRMEMMVARRRRRTPLLTVLRLRRQRVNCQDTCRQSLQPSRCANLAILYFTSWPLFNQKLVSLSKASESLPATDNVGDIGDEEENGSAEDHMDEKKDEKKEEKKKEKKKEEKVPKKNRKQAERIAKPKFSLAQ